MNAHDKIVVQLAMMTTREVVEAYEKAKKTNNFFLLSSLAREMALRNQRRQSGETGKRSSFKTASRKGLWAGKIR